MSLDFDPTNDFADVVDGTEAVTLLYRDSSDQTVVTESLRRALSVREAEVRNRYDTWKKAASDGRVTKADVVWHLPASQLSTDPRLGDRIVDAQANSWTILDLRLSTLRTRWQCVCCNVAVVYELSDTIDILKATYAKGDAGAAEATWLPSQTGVRARIQLTTVDMTTDRAARRTKKRYRIFLDQDITLDHTHRILGSDGTVYTIRATTGAQRLGEPQTVDAETDS